MGGADVASWSKAELKVAAGQSCSTSQRKPQGDTSVLRFHGGDQAAPGVCQRESNENMRETNER